MSLIACHRFAKNSTAYNITQCMRALWNQASILSSDWLFCILGITFGLKRKKEIYIFVIFTLEPMVLEPTQLSNQL